MRKIISIIKLKSCFIIPLFTAIIIFFINHNYKIINNISEDKLDPLIGVVGALMGVLITVLTVYVSFPKDSGHMKRIRETGHHSIFISNINAGIILYTICILSWLFGVDKTIILTLFLCGISNTMVGAYYISVLTRFT
jgi:hypothetical protein